MEFQKLTVHHYSVNPEEERRITLSPMNISLVAAATEDTMLNGRSLRNVTVLFGDGGSVDMTINHSDLELLETAIGSFCLGY